MTRTRQLRWRLNAALILCAVVLVVTLALADHWALAIVIAALAGCVFVAIRWATPEHDGASMSHWQAQELHVQTGAPIIYWRPASGRCLWVRWYVGSRADRALWVDVWSDDEAAAFVRDVNDGAEIVPTLITREGDAVGRPARARIAAELALDAPA